MSEERMKKYHRATNLLGEEALPELEQRILKNEPFADVLQREVDRIQASNLARKDPGSVARNIMSSAIGKHVSDNYANSIKNQMTGDEYADFVKKFYPEVNSNIIDDLPEHLKGEALGAYGKGTKNIYLKSDLPKNLKLGVLGHEAGHALDAVNTLEETGRSIENKPALYSEFTPKKILGASNKAADIVEDVSPALAKHLEDAAQHHIGRPWEYSNLIRLVKEGKLRNIAPLIGPAIGVGAAIASKDAAAMVPILNEAENVGEGSDIVEGLEPAFPTYKSDKFKQLKSKVKK